MNLRQLHRKIAPVFFLPLLLSAITGVGYRLGRTWLGLGPEFGGLMMTLHEGRFLGQPLVPVYVLLTGLGLLSLTVTGVSLLRRRAGKPKGKLSWRSLHRWLAPVLMLPLFVSAVTGVAFRLGRAWFNLPPEQTSLLLRLHQGSYLGSTLRVYYILLLGLGLVAMLITGLQMTGIWRSRRPSS